MGPTCSLSASHAASRTATAATSLPPPPPPPPPAAQSWKHKAASRAPRRATNRRSFRRSHRPRPTRPSHPRKAHSRQGTAARGGGSHRAHRAVGRGQASRSYAPPPPGRCDAASSDVSWSESGPADADAAADAADAAAAGETSAARSISHDQPATARRRAVSPRRRCSRSCPRRRLSADASCGRRQRTGLHASRRIQAQSALSWWTVHSIPAHSRTSLR